jgi:hypothetical protein
MTAPTLLDKLEAWLKQGEESPAPDAPETPAIPEPSPDVDAPQD